MKTTTTQPRREMSIRTIGKVNGHTLKIQTWARINAADCRQPNDVLWWGDKRITLDTGNMRPRLARLIPRGFAVCPAGDWSEFIRWANAFGDLK